MSPHHSYRQTYWQVHALIGWGAALWAGVIAGIVFAMLNIGLGWVVRGESPWTPLRNVAAIALGPDALAPATTFDARVVLVAIVVHLFLSMLYAIFLALLLPTTDRPFSILLGGFYGLALYYINFYGFDAFSPWFAVERGWVSIASHFVFGAVLAFAYLAINARTLRRSPGHD
jgi:hypothetical protein